MTNEQLLLQIGRLMVKAIQESEERMKVYVHDVVHNAVQASEERTKEQIQDVNTSLSASIEDLRGVVQQAMEESEKMAIQIAATLTS